MVFFVGPHTLVTAFHGVRHLGERYWRKVSDTLFIVHPETKERIPVHSIQALNFETDLAILHIKEYKSPVYYELFEGLPESLSSSEAYIWNYQEQSLLADILSPRDQLPQFKGTLLSQYPSEVSFMKTLSLVTVDPFEFALDPLSGLSGAPVFSMNGKVIGVGVS